MSDINGDTFVHVKGLSALQKAMDELPAKIEANIMRAALAAGARVIRDRARAICPLEVDPPGNNTYKKSLGWTPGALKRSLKVSSRLDRAAGRVTATVRAGDKVAYYAKWVEFGTAAHWIKSKNKQVLFFNGRAVRAVEHPGARKNPFMRIAMDAEAQRALLAVGQRIQKRLTADGINTPDLAVGDTE